ncbi:MAG: hypothetical protein COT73_01165 [Bdellovibrio sp. CG10_big_fil_rev_8_21_14_0_10_47_8]|nr:MAG: hypothetical protein COT73_01165 [Bdellovibrio sp. CG10_big_fil_rev_8_21_14_0_10_47_8]
MNNDERTEILSPVLVPLEALGEDTLNALIESFILREGTDYGASEILLATKMQQIRKQLDRGDVKIVFDPNSESVTLMTAGDWKKMGAHGSPSL